MYLSDRVTGNFQFFVLLILSCWWDYGWGFLSLLYYHYYYFSNVYTHCGAQTQRPQDQESRALSTEPARCPRMDFFLNLLSNLSFLKNYFYSTYTWMSFYFKKMTITIEAIPFWLPPHFKCCSLLYTSPERKEFHPHIIAFSVCFFG